MPCCSANSSAWPSDTRNNTKLAERIRHKFKIKNTTGYSLNALIDYEDPIDILSHLMIGSEGTLGFISRITYNTVVEDPFKASALVFFPDIRTACEAVIRLKPQPVSAVELLDRPALHSVENKPGLPTIMRDLGEEAAALLIEVRAATVDGINERISQVPCRDGRRRHRPSLWFSRPIRPPARCTGKSARACSRRSAQCAHGHHGDHRGRGLPGRAPGRRHPRPAARCSAEHGYHEAIIFGHALEATCTSSSPRTSHPGRGGALRRLHGRGRALVIDRYDGSLKAEHGTGRNMAPCRTGVGAQAIALMRGHQTLRSHGLLDPGVVLDDDRAHRDT